MSYIARPDDQSESEGDILTSLDTLSVSSNIQFLRKATATTIINASVLSDSSIVVTGAPTSITLALSTTGVGAATYGSATQVGQFTVDTQGRITSASNVTIAIASTSVTDFNEAAQDAVGLMVDATLTYVDATPLLGINLANPNTWTALQTFNLGIFILAGQAVTLGLSGKHIEGVGGTAIRSSVPTGETFQWDIDEDIEMELFSGFLSLGDNAVNLDFSTPTQLGILIGGTLEVTIATNAMTFDNGVTDTGFEWATSGVLGVTIAGAIEASFSANNLTFENGATDVALNWAISGELRYFVGGTLAIQFAANLMTFNNGATDTAIGWSNSGQLDFFVGATAEMRLTADALTFESGASDVGLGWSGSGVLDFTVGGTDEMSMRSNSLTFNNGTTDTGLSWVTDATLGFFIGSAATIEMSLVANQLTFNNGTTDTFLDWTTDGELVMGTGTTEYFMVSATEVVVNDTSADTNFRVESDGQTHMLFVDAGVNAVGVNQSAPTAYIHLGAGTATANTAPLKFTSGTNLTTTEAGAIEFNGTDLFFSATNSGNREKLNMGSMLSANANRLASPADATTYFIGGFPAALPSTTGGNQRIYIPRAGTVRAAYFFINNGGTLGSGETSTVSFRLNDTTDTTISSAVTTSSANQVFSNTALSVAVAAGDFFEIKWVAPTWATNPTNLTMNAVIYID